MLARTGRTKGVGVEVRESTRRPVPGVCGGKPRTDSILSGSFRSV